MFKGITKRDIYRALLYISLIVFFTISICKPFLTSNGHDLFLYHIFNPTNVGFDGTIKTLYAYPIIVVTYFTLIATIIPKFNNIKWKIIVGTMKITIFFSYLFAIINYFRVIYPNSFTIDFNTSNLYSGLYIFVIFLIMYLVMIVLDLITINQELIPYKHLFDINDEVKKAKKKYFLINRISIFAICFCFFSLFFVPFYINYTSYMTEPGFTHLLDLRTSVDYYLLSLFDMSFSLTIPSIILIFIVSTMPVLLLFKDDSKSLYRIISTMIFYILLMIFALTFGLVNKGTIKPILKLELNGVALFFIVASIIGALIVIFSSIRILYINKKEEQRNVELDSL